MLHSHTSWTTRSKCMQRIKKWFAGSKDTLEIVRENMKRETWKHPIFSVFIHFLTTPSILFPLLNVTWAHFMNHVIKMHATDKKMVRRFKRYIGNGTWKHEKWKHENPTPPFADQLFSKKKVFRKSFLKMSHRTNLVETKSFSINTFKRYRQNTVLIYTVFHRKWKQFLI